MRKNDKWNKRNIYIPKQESLRTNVEKRIPNLRTDIAKYKVSEIFEIINGKGITDEEISEIADGDIPCIQGGEQNNGILGYFSKKQIGDKKYKYIDEPSLTLSRVGSAGAINFHKKCFIGDKAKSLILKENYASHKSTYVYLYLSVILRANQFRYTYGRGIVNEIYQNIILELPTKNHQPDWEFMEEYIKSLSNSDLINTYHNL
ncbi:MAG: hypothetical protein LBC44_01720 [Mycoplasmataceae bacterium]|nr:hypothetical protein [Mycoplasmataceae bacterium]